MFRGSLTNGRMNVAASITTQRNANFVKKIFLLVHSRMHTKKRDSSETFAKSLKCELDIGKSRNAKKHVQHALIMMNVQLAAVEMGFA